MTTEDAIAQAREAFGRQAWGAAFAGLTSVDADVAAGDLAAAIRSALWVPDRATAAS